MHRSVHTDQARVVRAQEAVVARLVQAVRPLVPYALVLLLRSVVLVEVLALLVAGCVQVIIDQIFTSELPISFVVAFIIERAPRDSPKGLLLEVPLVDHA